jgi:glycosyltransferase involved in cell wall biosynthesis
MMRVSGRPTVVLAHNVRPHEHIPGEEHFARWTLGRASGVVVHASSVRDEVKEIAPASPVTVVPHPPNLRVSRSDLPPRPPLRLLCLGFVRRYKGFDVAVDALGELLARGLDARLTIAGSVWDEKTEWQERVTAAAVRGRVELRDRYASDDEIVSLLRDHHIVVLPYRSATQSGIVPLAYAAGRPVVVSDVGGLGDVVRDRQTGRLVRPEQPHDLADAIAEVAASLDRYASEAAAAATRWEEVADAVLATVHEAGDARKFQS